MTISKAMTKTMTKAYVFFGVWLRTIALGTLFGGLGGGIYGTFMFPIVGTLYGIVLGGLAGLVLGIICGLFIGLIIVILGTSMQEADHYWIAGTSSAIITVIGAIVVFGLMFREPITPYGNGTGLNSRYLVFTLLPALVAGVTSACASRGVVAWGQMALIGKMKAKRKPKSEVLEASL
jgi:eukaryotic-like serine/threonine-protein kinase